MSNFLSEGMLVECPCDDATQLQRIEVDFAFPVFVTQEQQRSLVKLVADMADSPWNQPKNGVHWLAGIGSKPNWSRMDAVFLGKQADDGAPVSGEPTFDSSVFHLETCARGFVDDKERLRKEQQRLKNKTNGQPRPRIVCLCGSTRFYQAFQEANYRETMAGKIVLSVGFYRPSPQSESEVARYQGTHGESWGCTPEPKIALDVLHKQKIDLADEVLVLNIGGYIGESTRSEIRHAIDRNKPIRFLEPNQTYYFISPRRRFKCEQLCPQAIAHHDRIVAADPPLEHVDAERCSGLAACVICSHQLHDHPNHPYEPYLTITCEGQSVKL